MAYPPVSMAQRVTIKLDQLVDDVTGLVSWPQAALRVNSMVNDGRSSAEEIGEVISADPALTGRLLRLANSALYGRSGEVRTIQRAIALVGMQRIRDLLLLAGAAEALAGLRSPDFPMDEYWEHSLRCGLLARNAARRRRYPEAETLFVAGLLHDIGRLVMYTRLPELCADDAVIALTGDDEQAAAAERECVGFDHAELGAALVRSWKFPAMLVTCIGGHHGSANGAESADESVAYVRCADVLARAMDADAGTRASVIEAHGPALAAIGLSAGDVEELVRGVGEEADTVRDMLTGRH